MQILSDFLTSTDSYDSNFLDQVHRTIETDLDFDWDKANDMSSARRVLNQERWMQEDEKRDKKNSDARFYDEKSVTLNDETLVLSSRYNDLSFKWVILILEIVNTAAERIEFYSTIFIIKHMISK